MPDMLRPSRTVPAEPTLAAISSPELSVRESGSAVVTGRLYSIDQSGMSETELPEDEEPGLILWGDVYIESRHPCRIAATGFTY